MTDFKNKRLTRRDAIKLLGAAAGASVLANIPSKWSKPSLAGGVLPAHAQTSCIAFSQINIAGDGDWVGFIDQGPFPDLNGPKDYNAWLCQNGCLQIFIFMTSGSSLTIQFTTLTHQFNLKFNQTTPVHDVLVNLATGEYAVDFVGSVGSCDWVRGGKRPGIDKTSSGYQ